MWEGGDNTAFQTARLFHMKMNNPYIRFYFGQQGREMSVFRGSPWQMGHGQKGYGLGGLFCSVARLVMPLVKSGAKALGNIALNSGANFVSDVLAGKNVKQAAKAHVLEGVNTAKTKAAQRVQRFAQTGQGRARTRSRSTRQPTKRTGRKRKASVSMTRRKQTKRPRTSPRDIWLIMSFVHST